MNAVTAFIWTYVRWTGQFCSCGRPLSTSCILEPSSPYMEGQAQNSKPSRAQLKSSEIKGPLVELSKKLKIKNSSNPKQSSPGSWSRLELAYKFRKWPMSMIYLLNGFTVPVFILSLYITCWVRSLELSTSHHAKLGVTEVHSCPGEQ